MRNFSIKFVISKKNVLDVIATILRKTFFSKKIDEKQRKIRREQRKIGDGERNEEDRKREREEKGEGSRKC
jgi:hypothetical protein